jgi:hypothetical protein
MFMPEQKVSLGACLHIDVEDFIAMFSCYNKAVMMPAEAEARAYFKVSNGSRCWVMLAYFKVIVEMDCKMVVDDVQQHKLIRQSMILLLISVVLYFQTIKTMQLSFLGKKKG